MAWAVKYSKQFQRMGTTATYRIDILSEAGGPVITPDKMGADPCQLKTLASERDENKIVIGSELTFEFVLLKRNGEADYDPLFESEYREHIVKFYNDDTSTLLWQGYLQPENMYKSMFDSNMHIYCSATDALKDLSEDDFTDGGAIITGHVTGLQIIKYCLTKLDEGAQFQYNFVVKCGTKHALQGVNATALEEVTHDTRRFITIRDGKTEFDSCLTVIEKVLKPYQCTLQQWGGKYYIIQQHETATDYYIYNWALVFQSKVDLTVTPDVVNIDAYKFSRDADVSYIAPLKEAQVRLLNRNIGDSLVPNINDYDGGDWDYTNYTGAFDDSGTVMELTAESGALPVDNGYVTLAADESIQKLTEGDYLKITFNFRTTNLLGLSTWPYFTIIVVKDGVDYTGLTYSVLPGWGAYESEVSAIFKLIGAVGETHDYNFKINVYSDDPVNDYDIELGDFNFTRVVYIDEDSQEDVTFDSFHRGTVATGKVKTDVIDLHFGDSPTTGDFAGLIYSGAQTDEWNRADTADAAGLIYLYCKNLLNSRQEYTEYIVCRIKDTSDNITPINYLQWDSKLYHIVSYSRSWRTSWIELHLRQWLTADVTMGWEYTPLTSVDGESTSRSSTYITSSGGNIWSAIVGRPVWMASSTDAIATLPASTTVPDGGTIGQAAGPLLTFDDTNNYLEITGCRVGIGTGTPENSLDVSGSGRFTGYNPCTAGAGIEIGYDSGRGEMLCINRDTPAFNALRIRGSAIYLMEGSVGVNTLTPNAKIESLSTTEQLRLSYDATHYTSFTVAAGGGLSITPLAGQDLSIVLSGTGDLDVNNGFSTIFFVDTSAAHVGINCLATNADFEVTGTVYVSSTTKLNSIVQHKDFVGGFAGNNWQISSVGDAEFGNVLIRGGLNVYELIINRLHYQNGGLIIGAGAGKIGENSIIDNTQGAEVIEFEDPNGAAVVPFTVGSIVMVQNVDINRTSVVKKIVREVDSIAATEITFKATAGWTPAVDDVGAFASGDEVVAIGHTATAALQNSIYLTATDTNNPYMAVFTEVDSYADWLANARLKVLVGNLAKIASVTYGDLVMPANPGYGFFSDNCYLSGKIVATSGLIGGFTISSTDGLYSGTGATRVQMKPGEGIWCGATAIGDAPFNVDEAGNMTAIGVVEFGTNTQDYGGDDYNCAIKGADIWENSYNGDGSNIFINRIGHGGTTDHYRGMVVYDGKGHKVFGITGEASPISIQFGNDGDPIDTLVYIFGGVIFEPRANPPAAADEGMVYADTDHHLYYYNGSAWKQLDNA